MGVVDILINEHCVMLPTDDCKYGISLQFQNGELNCNCPDRCS